MAGVQWALERYCAVFRALLHTKWHTLLMPLPPSHVHTPQAVVKAVERHLMQQLDSSPSPAEELRARETADWFGRCSHVWVEGGGLLL